MKSISRLPWAAFLAALGAIIASASPGPAPSSAHQQALQQYRETHVRALLTGNADLLLPVAHAEAVRLMPVTQLTVFGRANAIAYHRAFVGRFEVREYSRTSAGQFDFGPRVVEIGRFRQKLVHKTSGETSELNGKYLDAWEKRPDGTLQLITAAWNCDSWPPDAEAFRFPEVPSVRTAFAPRVPVNSAVSFELAALDRLHEAAVQQHDAKRWSRLYADDAIMLANMGELLVGRKAVDDYIAAHSQDLPVFEKLDLRADRIEELGDYVFEYASQIAVWRRGEDSGAGTGKNLRIWRRGPDQALKIVLSIGSYD